MKIIIKILLFIGFILVMYYIDWNSREKILKTTQIFGLVEYIGSERGSVFIKIKNIDNEFYFPVSYNYEYKPHRIGDFVQSGDSIVKNINSDTLFIYRNGVKYYFIIGKTDLNF